MKTIYRTWQFFCKSCGRKATGWDAIIPVDRDERACGPATCGHCGGHGFRPELKGAA